MTTTMNTRHYEFAHGKKPRGYGHWAFTFDSDRFNDMYWVEGSYGDAAKAAKAEAKKRNAYEVKVMS